jgi:hypothetical protein
VENLLLQASFNTRAGSAYPRLTSLLASGDWEGANQETTAIMLSIARREAEGLLWLEDMENFPREELCLLNHLWLRHSKGRFGFGVQKRLWHQVGGDSSYEAECRLGDQVGWRHENSLWLSYDEITFGLHAPRGHLPLAFAWWVEGAGIVLDGLGKFWSAVDGTSSRA